MTRTTNNGRVGALASTNSPYFHPLTLIITIDPNMQKLLSQMNGVFTAKRKNDIASLMSKVFIVLFKHCEGNSVSMNLPK